MLCVVLLAGLTRVNPSHATPPADPVFARFQAWCERKPGAMPAALKAGWEAEGTALAQARREALAALIRTHPKRALELALPLHRRTALPPSVLAELETPVAGRGDFLVFAVDHWAGDSLGQEVIVRQAVLHGKTYRAFVYGRRQHQITTPQTPLFGIALDGDLAVHEDPARVLAAEEVDALVEAGRVPPVAPCPVCAAMPDPKRRPVLLDAGGQILRVCCPEHGLRWNRQLGQAGRRVLFPDGGHVDPVDPGVLGSLTQGPKTLLFMRVSFADDITEPITAAEATSLMNAVNAHFVEASFNTAAIVSTITPLLALPQTKLWYGTNGPGSVLDHARKAARAAGFAYEQYDLDIVRHSSVPGFDWGGLAAVGGRGLWLQSSGFGTAVHELGHNFGLVHANSWNAVRPPQTGAYPDNPNNYPFDPGSVLGHDSAIGPGTDAEYGDPFDIMGGGGGHFNAVGKAMLGWLPEPYVRTVTSNGTYRLHAMDSPSLASGRYYALRVRKDFERDYWASHRTRLENPWLQSGLELHWNFWSQSGGFSDILDTTPGTGPGKQDAAVVIGRTFTDAAAAVHLTPVARGGSGTESWMDVVVHLGVPATNRPPHFTLQATAAQVGTNVYVDFSATVTDPDGDGVALHWDFGDGTFGPNTTTVSKRWEIEGDYVVRCEVSDLKGGLSTLNHPVKVGALPTYRVTGQVQDIWGNPLQGVRVHNGRPNPDYRWAYTDRDGRYTLANLPSGTYTNAAFLFGYRIAPLTFANPINLVGADAANADYLATPLPAASVSPSVPASENQPASGHFTIMRSGPTHLPQAVLFQLSGTAAREAKYRLTSASVTLTNVGMNEGFSRLVTNTADFEYIVLPAGIAATNLVVDPINNTTSEGTQHVTLTLALPMQSLGFLADTNITNSVFVPGWEVLPVNLEPTWFQTYPDYALAPGAAEASLAIRDDEPPSRPTVSLFALDDVATESGQDLGLISVLRFGSLDEPLDVAYTVGGTALPGTDYVPLPGSISFPVGRDTVTLAVRAVENLFAQPSRTVIVTLATNATYAVGAASATVHLVDNDLPTVILNAPDPVAVEDTDPGSFLVTRIGDLGQDLRVSYLVSGTAVSGRDYRPLPGNVLIPAQSVSAPIVVQPVDNRTLQGDLSVTLQLADTPIYNVGTPRAATVVIHEKQLPTVGIVTTIDPAVEPGTAGEFTISRTGSTAAELTVLFMTGGSALAGNDYAPIGSSLTIPAGATSAALTITPSENRHREGAETVVVRLLPSPHYNLGPQFQAMLNLDDPGGGLPAVGFTLSASQGPESEAAPVIAVAVSAEPEESAPVTVEYRVTGGTAITNVDYQFGDAGRLMFTNNGPRIQILPLTILDNTLLQPNRTLIVTLFDPGPTFTNEIDPETMETNIVLVPTPTNAFFDVFRTHIYSILDDDLGTVTVEATDPIARESGPKPALLTFTRTGALDRPLTVHFQVTGTATSGSDYVPLGSAVTFPAGTNRVELPVVPLDNPSEDPPQTIIVTLLSVPGGQVGSPPSATVTLIDNDGTLQFTAAAFTASEAAGAATITVQRTGSLDGSDTIEFATSPGTAVPGADYTPVQGTLRFAPGESLQSIALPLLDDALVETNETVLLTLRNPTGGLPLGGQSTALLTIADDDSALEFAAPAFQVNENATNAIITVYRLGVATNKVTVDYVTGDGSATDGVDYLGQSGTLQFAAGATQLGFLVPILDNARLETNRTVMLALREPTGGATLAGQTNAILHINEDDCALEFEGATYHVLEYTHAALLTVHRLGGTVHPVQVRFQTHDLTARAGFDYLAQSGAVPFAGDAFLPSTNGTGLLTFHPGDTTRTVSIPLLDNTVGDRERAFVVTLSSPLGPPTGTWPGSIGLGLLTHATVNLIDDEGPGHVDYGFDPGNINRRIRSVSVAPDRSIVFAGEFDTVEGILFGGVARLHPDGHLDYSFTPGAGADDTVHATATQPDGKILLGGAFGRFDGVARPRVARLNADGSLDHDFDPGSGANNPVRALAAQPDGRILIGGDFTVFDGTGVNHLARLAADGSLDPTLPSGAGANDAVLSLALQPDGHILLAGRFTAAAGREAGRIARLRSDGSPDPAFRQVPGADGPIHALALQPDGRILIGGAFTTIHGLAARHLARLLPDGSPDATFLASTDVNDTIYGLAVAPEGGIYVGGAFTRLHGVALNRFARLNPDGALDAVFNHSAGANGAVLSLAAQPDGALVIAGEFTQVHGLPRAGLARIHAGEKFALGIVEFGAAAAAVSETAGQVVIPIVRTGNLQTEFTVNYFTTDGTARAGTRYTAQSGTLSFAAGETSLTVSIPILDGPDAEGNQSFLVTLAQPSEAASLGPRSEIAVTIVDDETSIAFALATADVSEEAGTVELEVIRTGDGLDRVTVDFATQAGAATADEDFGPVVGTLEFAPGEIRQTLTVPILDDTLIEPDETFRLVLSNPTGGGVLGSQSTVVVTIVDNDGLPPDYRLTFAPSPGGSVFPAAGSYPAGSTQLVIATPEPNYVFAGWSGSVVSAANPLLLTLDRDHELVPEFRVVAFSDDFESGGLQRLPWQVRGPQPWVVTSAGPASGRFAARSGLLGDGEVSSLLLAFSSPAGTGSFAYRVHSEASWDFLEFHLNGRLVERWSGLGAWNTFRFAVPAGYNVCEWRYVKDANFSAGQDTAWLDEVYLPLGSVDPTPAAAVLSMFLLPEGAPLLRLQGQAGRSYVLEHSVDLRTWQPVSTNFVNTEPLFFTLPTAPSVPFRYYRAITP